MHLSAALLGSLLLNLALVWQAEDARQAPLELSLKPQLIWHLMRRWRWWGGTLGMIASALLQIYALRSMSVAVVQALCSGGILVIPLYNATFFGHRLRAGELAAVGLVIAGTALGSVTIPEQVAILRVPFMPVFVAATAVSLVAFFGATRFRSGIAAALVAAVGMSAAALLQKVLALITVGGGEMAIAIVLLVSCGGIGFLAQMSALQLAPVAQVAPTILAVSTALPIFVSPLIFGESWPHAGVTLASLCVSVAAATWLSFLVSPTLAPREPLPTAAVSD